MTISTESIFALFGGLALFIYGMNFMGEGLKKVAGEKMRTILQALTANPFIGIIFGAIITALIQSSSATSVMVIGLISANLLTLSQAIPVMMGANIGTTFTAQIIAFKIGHYAYPIAFIGFILYFMFKNKKVKYAGQTVLAFGILFIGLNTMSAAMTPIAQSEWMQDALLQLQNVPIFGLISGMVMTMIAQSSSAIIGILQTLSETAQTAAGEPLIPLISALPILFGSNIGTTITAIIASIGASKYAKRAALANSVFNIFGAVLFMFLLKPFAAFMDLITPDKPFFEIISRQIANSHTIFNIIITLLFIPFIGMLAKIVSKLIPGDDSTIERRTVYLDKKVMKNPSLALELVSKELCRMFSIARMCIELSKSAYVDGNMKDAEKVFEAEDTIDLIQCEIINYLSNLLSTETLTHKQSVRLAGLMHSTSDVERIGDYCENIAESAQIKSSEKLPFSEGALKEISDTFDLITNIALDAELAMKNNDVNICKEIIGLEQKMDSIEKSLRTSHIDRLNDGQCNPHSGISFIELIHSLERIADHCTNVAEAVLQYNNDELSFGEKDLTCNIKNK